MQPVKFLLKMFQLLVIVIALTSQVNTDTISDGRNRIIDGSALTKSKFYEVAIVSSETDGSLVQLCTGALIGSRWVLTSAYCAKRRDVLTIQYASDSIDLSGDEGSFVMKKYIHPYYSSFTSLNDIAILQIDPIVSSRGVQILSLPKPAINNYYLGKVASVSGWGATGDHGDYSLILNYRNVIIIDNNYCEPAYYMNACKLCTQGRSVCEGDQGAPLVYGDEIIGVVSANLDARVCEGSVRAAFTRVDSYLPWINSIITKV